MLGGDIGLLPWQAEATAILNVHGGTFRNNHAPGKWGNDFGGAIANFNRKSVHLENAVIEENSAQFGGAIYSGTPLEMKDCRFVNNTAAKGGGAIYATGSLTAKGIRPWLMAVFDVCQGLSSAANPGKQEFRLPTKVW